jgi:adenylylsulfate kinase-like enzyme
LNATPPIFIITGTPGAGKSSVAAALMQRFEFGLHIPVDDLREFVVSGIAHPVPEWTDETSRQFRLARAAAAQMARLYAAAGFAVAIDDVISPAEAQSLLVEALDSYAVHKVLLYPSVEAALERNARRANKSFDTQALRETIGALHQRISEQQYAEQGWIVIDTSEQTIEETVELITSRVSEADEDSQHVDKRGRLDEEVFSYRASKDKVFLSWYGKQVMILKGRDAEKFLSKIDGLDGKAAQLVMAKITGNFKRGNERHSKAQSD